MSGAFGDVVEVAAPGGALGWTVDRGFVADAAELDIASRQGAVIFHVSDGTVRVPADETLLAGLVRTDRDAAVLAARLDELFDRLVDIAEQAVERLAAADRR